MAGLIAEKIGMTQIRNEQGNFIPATLLKVKGHKVLQVKTEEKDNVDAVVVATGYCEKSKSYGKVKQFPISEGISQEKDQEFSIEVLEGITEVKISSISKGKGFQGGMKRHHFSGGRASHGAKYIRAGGSIGNRKPRRTRPGRKMPGHMGLDLVTLRKVPVLDVNKELSLFAVKGAVPGSQGGTVYISF